MAYFPSPPQGVWHLGPIPLRAYALFIIVGIIAALLIGDRRWVARGGERGVIYDIALWAVPFGLIGGRLYHVATDWRTYFGEGGAGPIAALRIWDGGLGIWGAVALGGVGAWIGCRRRAFRFRRSATRSPRESFWRRRSAGSGNYFNQELYGRETTMPWGLEIFYRRDPAGFVDVHSLDGVSTGQLAMVVQPTFLYELLWNVLVFAVLIYLDRRFTIGHGRLFAVYVALLLRRAVLRRAAARRHRHAYRRNPGQLLHVDVRLHRRGGVPDPGAQGSRRSGDAQRLGGRVAGTRLDRDDADDAVAGDDSSGRRRPSPPSAPDDEDADKAETADTAAVDKPDVDAEAVVAEADAAEVDAPEVEVAATPEPDDAPEAEA